MFILKPIVAILFIFSSLIGFSQVNGGDLDKLAKLFNEGKYESCLYKADGLTYKEDYSRDPEPLLYVSMCFYKISVSGDEDLMEDYKDALKQSIKYATKFVRKDKKDVLYSQNLDYVNTLKDEQKALINKYKGLEKYNKVASASKVYNKLNREQDFSILYYTGVNEVLSNNLSQGQRNVDLATEGIEGQIKAGTLKIDSRMQPLIIDGFLKYSEYLVKEKNLEGAKKCLVLGKTLFPNDGYLNVQAKMVDKALEGK